MTGLMTLPQHGRLVPNPDRVQLILVPNSLWRVRLESGGDAWWKRAVTPAWKRAFAIHRHSRAQREYSALQLMRARGLPAPEPLAWETRRRGPFLLESVIVTRETPGLVRLDHFLQEELRPERRTAALQAAGALAARMHARGIGHFRLLPKNLHLEREHPERAWLLDAPYACAWRGSVPRRVRVYDLCTLCGPRSGLLPQDAETVVESYELASGTVTERPRLLCSQPFAMRIQRVAYYLASVWTQHRPEHFIPSSASR